MGTDTDALNVAQNIGKYCSLLYLLHMNYRISLVLLHSCSLCLYRCVTNQHCDQRLGKLNEQLLLRLPPLGYIGYTQKCEVAVRTFKV